MSNSHEATIEELAARVQALEKDKAALQAELSSMSEEFEDLKMMHEASVAHGVFVEDELAEKNAELERTQARLEEELGEAEKYVWSLLPSPAAQPFRTDWRFIPSSELGGDAFGYHWIDDDHFAVYLLDVSGHGVGAALLSAAVLNVLRSSALPETDFRDAGQVMTGLNKAFLIEDQNGMFFTIWYGVINRSTRTINYASGGHPDAFLVDFGTSTPTLHRLATPQMTPGCLPGITYQSKEMNLPDEGSLFVYCDGLFEIEKKDTGTIQRFAEFIEVFQSVYHSQDVSLDVLTKTLQDIQGSEKFDDDYSIIKVDIQDLG